MTDERAILEGKTREELIEELLERREEVEALEEELAGTVAAENVSDGEADKYAALLQEADRLIYHYRYPTHGLTHAGFPDRETYAAVLSRHEARVEKYQEASARAAKKRGE